MRTLLSWILLPALVLAHAGAATAQEPVETLPIGRYVLDLRGAMPRLKADPLVAAAINVTPANMPTRGRGYVVGGHWYPLRKGAVTLGVGGEWLVSQARRTLEPTTEGGKEGPTAIRDLTMMTPQVSLNFGKRQGWSYISGGIGYSTFTAERQADPRPPGIIVLGTPVVESRQRPLTIAYGGGARWFLNRHMAISMDLHFYRISAQAAGAARPAMPATRLLVLSLGTAFK